MKKEPRHKLTNMQIREVSVVKSPANSQPFLFLKGDNEDEKTHLIKLDGPVTVAFESDGKAKGTKIVVNDVVLKKVDSFCLHYYKPGDEGIDGPAVSISYSRKKEEGGGFKGIETYWLTKNENKGDNLMNEKFVDVMKKLSGKDDYSYVRKEESEDANEVIQKALDTISTYSEDMPEELRNSVVTLSEYAASAVPVEKQEKTNADTEKVEKDDSEKKEKDEKVAKTETESAAKETKTEDDLAKGTEEILTAVKKLKDVVEKSKETIEAIDTRLETVEKSTGARKSVKGQENVKKDGVAFPSLIETQS